MAEHTFVVEKTCPICGQTTRIVKTKDSKLMILAQDDDFCRHYKDFNPYFYKIWLCEHCGFAADEKTFLNGLPERHRETIRGYLEQKKLNMEFTEVRGVPEAVASFKLAIFFDELIKAPLARQAGLWLELGWVYRDSGEEEKEQQALVKAADLYDESLMTEHYPINGMSDTMAIYLIGVLRYRTGDYDTAEKYISRIMGDRNVRETDYKLYKASRDIWQNMRELAKNKQEDAKAAAAAKQQEAREEARAQRNQATSKPAAKNKKKEKKGWRKWF